MMNSRKPTESRLGQQNKTVQSDSKKKAVLKAPAKTSQASGGIQKSTPNNRSSVSKAAQNSRPDSTKSRRQSPIKSVQNKTGSTTGKDSPVTSQQISAIQQHQDDKSQRSIQASQALTHNNPDIADLSDLNRPTKTAERYSELYDNEWTETYEAMTRFKKTELQEPQIIGFLLEILEGAYVFCGEKAKTFRKKLIAEIKKHEKVALADLKKKKAAAEIKELQKTFFENNLKGIAEERGLDPPKPGRVTERYANKAVELSWWMHMQEPPVHMVVSSVSKANFDPNIYRAYTKSGQIPEFFVWPPLRLYAEGGVLVKGVVQYK